MISADLNNSGTVAVDNERLNSNSYPAAGNGGNDVIDSDLVEAGKRKVVGAAEKVGGKPSAVAAQTASTLLLCQ